MNAMRDSLRPISPLQRWPIDRTIKGVSERAQHTPLVEQAARIEVGTIDAIMRFVFYSQNINDLLI